MPTTAELILNSKNEPDPGISAWKKIINPGEITYITHIPHYASREDFRTYFISCSKDDLYGLVYFYRYTRGDVPPLDELAESFKNPDFIKELYGEDYMRYMRRFPRSFHRDINSVLGKSHLIVTHKR